MNATHLFGLPDPKCSSSESFWTSLFVIQLLEIASRGIRFRIPIHTYDEDEIGWRFNERQPIMVPPNLTLANAWVEARISGELLEYLLARPTGEIRNEFPALEPDIILRLGDLVLIIETKTIGANISAKEDKYVQLCERLRGEQPCHVEYCLLISAGHEHNDEVRKQKRKTNIILWEKFFEEVEATIEKPLISRLVPDLRKYYEKQDYLSGVWNRRIT